MSSSCAAASDINARTPLPVNGMAGNTPPIFGVDFPSCPDITGVAESTGVCDGVECDIRLCIRLSISKPKGRIPDMEKMHASLEDRLLTGMATVPRVVECIELSAMLSTTLQDKVCIESCENVLL